MRFNLGLTFLSLFLTNTSSFTVLPKHCAAPELRCSPLFMSEPSDTSSDSDILTVESEPYTPTEGEAMVTSVLDQLPATIMEISGEKRSSINEALLKLEHLNPTPNPTMSPLLNGVWELRYAAGYSPEWSLPSPTRQLALFLYSGGYSPGLFALALAQQLPSALVEVSDLSISISRDQPRVEAKVQVNLLGGAISNEVVVKARLEVESGVRLRETYESAQVMRQSPLELPSQVQYSRELFVTYVDDDVLVVRDASGVPEVLVRKEKYFRDFGGKEPSEIDDMGPPGSTDEQLPATD